RFGFVVGARSTPAPAPGGGAVGSGGADARRNHRQRIDQRLGLWPDQRPRHEEGWNPRVTDTTGLGTLDAQRLELLRRRIAERGLARPAVAGDTEAPAPDVTQLPQMSDGQRRMWFVQAVDPGSAVLNICVSYRVTGDIDVARLRQAV